MSMCLAASRAAARTDADALADADAALAALAASDASTLTMAEQAECLRQLERAESRLTAARAAILTAFTAQCGYQDDGHGSAKTWLAWQARTTSAAAAAAVGWARRLAIHPSVRGELAAGAISASWARQICDWTDQLPPACRADADVILLGAAAAGADLAGLAGLAEEIRKKTAQPDHDNDDGFEDRWLRVSRHWRGAGKLDGDLTPQAAAALTAVLAALGKKAGPEDTRSKAQRDHDALEEGCRRLIASGCLPDRAGQPTQIQLHMSLDQLRGEPGAPGAEAQWAGYGATAPPGADCDASIVPTVTGHPDQQLLDQLANVMPRDLGADATHADATLPESSGAGTADPGWTDVDHAGADSSRRERGRRAARDLVLGRAIELLSGPTGLAAFLRSRLLSWPAGSPSLPLDVGAATDTIPVHLRRAVILRDQHCGFPGCDQPPDACQVHHIIPRAEGGPTSLENLHLQCAFHHLIAIHRWGWKIIRHADGTVTAISPDHTRVLHSHGPPSRAA
jgi:hypothetical protein